MLWPNNCILESDLLEKPISSLWEGSWLSRRE